jgi:hypothetical protein
VTPRNEIGEKRVLGIRRHLGRMEQFAIETFVRQMNMLAPNVASAAHAAG